MHSAVDLHQRALAEIDRGRHARARTLLGLAHRRHPDRATRARLLLTQAYLDSEHGAVADGLTLLDEAESPDLPAELTARLSSQRGLLLMRSGDAMDALTAFTASLEELGDDPATVTRVILNRGNVHLQLRNLSAAAADFRRCSDAASAHGLEVYVAKAEHNLGYVELLAGDLPAALRRMEAVRPALAAMSPAFAATCDTDRAQALLAAGLSSEAESALAAADDAFGSQRLRQSQAEAELLRAQLALSTDRHVDAIRLARLAASRFRRRGSTSWALRADAVVIAAQVDSHRDTRAVLRAAPGLAAALDAERLRDEARTVRLNLARALLRAERLDEARALLGSVRTPATAPITTRLLDRAVRADLATTRRRPADARKHLRRGLAELFDWQSSFGSLDLQTGVAAHGRALARRGLRAAVADGRPEVVFDWSERARALAARVPAVRPSADTEAAAALEELRALRADLGGAGASQADRQRMGKLERQIRDRALYPPGPGIVTQPLALADLRSRLVDDDATLVSHLIVDGQVHALVASPSEVIVHDLGPYAPVAEIVSRLGADLDAAATRLPTAMRQAVTASAFGGCAELAKRLLDPLPLAAGPVLLVPSAALAAVPWTLLPPLAGVPVCVARTATAWALTRQPNETIGRVGLVAGPGVERAEDEVNRAVSSWPEHEALCGDAATASAVTALASRVDLLHVAAHGTHSADNPLFSGLELVDGPWFGHDIAAVDPVPAHVVLSACELGRATVRAGEETLGMTAAWQHAGARTVVASPVRVNDETACEVLSVHHSRLVAGDRPAVALAAAIGTVPAGSAPAPLLCFGAGW